MKKSPLVKKLTQAILASSFFIIPKIYADTSISTPTAGPVSTSTAGNVTVLTTGQINGVAVDALIVDAATATPVTITLVANNTFPNALFSTTSNGVNIQNGAPGAATVNVGSNTAITAFNAGVLVDNVGATITNHGTIQALAGGNYAIFITPNGLTPTISNTSGGIIQGSNQPSIADDPTGTGSQLILSNSGTITTTVANIDAIQLNTTFGAITNGSGGVIQTGLAGNGNAIDITGAAPLSGTINNTGLITANAGAGIAIANDFTGGVINNNSGGIIQTTTNGFGILIVDNFTSINNSGTIQATAGGGTPIFIAANSNGTINNAGLISAVNQPGIYAFQSITAINNSGTITTNTAGGAIQAGAATISSGITNTGNIINTGGPAVNLLATTNANFTQSGGIVSGDVVLAGHDETGVTGNVFDMNGGIINGDVIAASVVDNILNFRGGNINGTVFGGTTNDTFNFFGGKFTSLDGNAGADLLNVFGSFTAGSITSVETMDLFLGTFTANGPITGLDTQLTISAGARMVVNNSVNGLGDILNNGNLTINNNFNIPTGNTVNNGVLNVNSGGILTTNSYTQTATGDFVVDVNGLNPLGAIQTTAGNVLLAGEVRPTFSAGTYVPTGATFDVIKTLGGTITDTSTILPASLVIYFNKNVIAPCGAGECLRLTARRIPFTSLPIPPSAQGVADVLDRLALPPGPSDPDLFMLLEQLDIITDQQTLNNVLVDLGPPVNYALPMNSRIIMNSSFTSVQRRLKDLMGLHEFGGEDYFAYRRMDRNPEIFLETGQNFGDQGSVCGAEGCFYKVIPGKLRRRQVGLWAEGLGAVIDQAFRDNVEGYHAEAGGAMIGFDGGDLSSAVVGGAVSWVNIHSVSRNDTHNVLDTIGYQGTIYGWFSFCEGFFLDTYLGFATQKYRQRRNINVNDVIVRTAFSKFYGINYAAQADLMYGVLYKSWIIAPIVRVRYSRLSIDNYTELGSGGLNLFVNGNGYNEFVTGGGIRFGTKFTFFDATYSPEFSAMVLYDWYGKPEAYVASFIGGGGPFLTQGPSPAKLFSQYSIGLTAETLDGYIATVRYELEVRDHFFGNAGFFQLRYQWG